jgi:hypothetical protein
MIDWRVRESVGRVLLIPDAFGFQRNGCSDRIAVPARAPNSRVCDKFISCDVRIAFCLSIIRHRSNPVSNQELRLEYLRIESALRTVIHFYPLSFQLLEADHNIFLFLH